MDNIGPDIVHGASDAGQGGPVPFWDDAMDGDTAGLFDARSRTRGGEDVALDPAAREGAGDFVGAVAHAPLLWRKLARQEDNAH